MMTRSQFFQTIFGAVAGVFGAKKIPVSAPVKFPPVPLAPDPVFRFKYVATVLDGPSGVGGKYQWVAHPEEVH
jgi:hypothetical protein